MSSPRPSVHFEEKASCWLRSKNLIINNYRGLVGFFVPVFVVPFFLSKKPHEIVRNIWCWMLWSFLFIPVATPVTAFYPVFAFPFCGIIDSITMSKCYFNDVIALMIVGGWVAMALNNSGVDKRIMLSTLTSKSGKISPMMLLFKSTILAYFLSMFCRSTIVTSNITNYASSALNKLQMAVEENRRFKEIRYITCCAIFSSSAIGSIAILNASMPTLCVAGIWGRSDQGKKIDVFTFLDYFLFAFPTSLAMYIVNLIYFAILLKRVLKSNPDSEVKLSMMDAIQYHKMEIKPRINACEIFSLLAVLTSLVAYFTRRSKYFGWSDKGSFVKDATVAAIWSIVLHMVPSNLNFLRILTNKKRSNMILKQAPAMILFRYVNSNTYWGYFLLMGSGIALNAGVRASKLDAEMTTKLAQIFTDKQWEVTTLIVCFGAVALSCFIPGTAAMVILVPFILNSHHKKVHILSVGMGIGGSLGFTQPFRATPGYHCNKQGGVPIKHMIKYGIVNSLLCMLVLWLMLTYLAENIFGLPDIPIPT